MDVIRYPQYALSNTSILLRFSSKNKKWVIIKYGPYFKLHNTSSLLRLTLGKKNKKFYMFYIEGLVRIKTLIIDHQDLFVTSFRSKLKSLKTKRISYNSSIKIKINQITIPEVCKVLPPKLTGLNC